MVGTAQADNFGVFVKKIGYSVGVEFLLTRATDFGRAYASVASFRESEWTSLLKGWGLKSPNIGDVFGALDIARVHNREIYPGFVGESLGILEKLNGEIPEAAAQLAIATAVVRSDGDVFLNALRSGFDEGETGKALVRMIQAKREALFRIFSAPRDREAVARAVSIERQKTNRGSSTGGGLAALTRGQPLGLKAQGLGLPSSIDVFKVDPPSSDYLRKITVSRRGWAESLGLFSKGALTDEGSRFLIELANHGFARPDGTFLVWPTSFELGTNQFRPENFRQLGILSSWDFQLAIFEAMGGAKTRQQIDLELISRRISEIYSAYRDLSQNRSMIRNEVSSQIVTGVILGQALTRNEEAPDLDKVWSSDLSGYGITVRPSKTIEYAITVRTDGSQAS